MKREELFIVSKLWNTYHEAARVGEAALKSLNDWGLEYFDLYLIHFPVSLEFVPFDVRYPAGWHVDGATTIKRNNATIQETWGAMEGLVGKGVAKSIGVSNFQGQLIYDLLRTAKITPATLQIEHHPYLVQEKLIALAKAEGIAVTAYSSFGTLSFDEFNFTLPVQPAPLFEVPVIKSIAEKHGKTPAQVLLRWATQRGLAVIPKSASESRLKSNLECTEFDLSAEEIASISALDRNIRFNQPSNVSAPPPPPPPVSLLPLTLRIPVR